MNKVKKWLRILGPGMITGAADDDPSGIATYSQTGAQFGYGQLWVALLILPFQTAVQEACARIGAVTGQGITAVIKQNYNRKILWLVVGLIVTANTINIGANISAMAAATELLLPINKLLLAVGFTGIILGLEILVSYKNYAKILKWLTLSLLAYPLTAFIIQHPWLEVIKATFIPHMEWSFPFLFIITGVFGTTISPYMFFWQASEETEEEKMQHLLVGNSKPQINWRFIHNLRLDTMAGMLFSQIAAWSIILVAATVLNNNGITDIKTAADAAKALEPLVQTFPNAGYLAKLLFAVGIVGLGLLSIPILAGSAAYVLTEALGIKEGLNLKFKKAHGFYGTIIVATVVGLLMNLLGINPIKALVYTAVINGMVAVPLIWFIAKISANEKIMGKYASGWISKTLLWLTFLIMGGTALGMLLVGYF